MISIPLSDMVSTLLRDSFYILSAVVFLHTLDGISIPL